MTYESPAHSRLPFSSESASATLTPRPAARPTIGSCSIPFPYTPQTTCLVLSKTSSQARPTSSEKLLLRSSHNHISHQPPSTLRNPRYTLRRHHHQILDDLAQIYHNIPQPRSNSVEDFMPIDPLQAFKEVFDALRDPRKEHLEKPVDTSCSASKDCNEDKTENSLGTR